LTRAASAERARCSPRGSAASAATIVARGAAPRPLLRVRPVGSPRLTCQATGAEDGATKALQRADQAGVASVHTVAPRSIKAWCTVFDQLQQVLQPVKAPDGQPVLGEPIRTLDYSELSAQLDVDPEAFLSPKIRTLFDALHTRAWPDGTHRRVEVVCSRPRPGRLGPGAGQARG
jgi:hypothetical protein